MASKYFLRHFFVTSHVFFLSCKKEQTHQIKELVQLTIFNCCINVNVFDTKMTKVCYHLIDLL